MVKLNLGCGKKKMEGYVNIDVRKSVGPDLVADIRKLPYNDGTVDEIVVFSVLEHFPQAEVLPILTEWCRVLKAGGRITIKVPDIETLLKGKVTPKAIKIVYGGQDYEENFHKSGFTPPLLASVMRKAGFSGTKVKRIKYNLLAVGVK